MMRAACVCLVCGLLSAGTAAAQSAGQIQPPTPPNGQRGQPGNVVTAPKLAQGVPTAALTKPCVLNDATTVLIDVRCSDNYILTLTASSHTIANPVNAVVGQDLDFLVYQPASGGPYTVSWGTAFTWQSGSSPTLATAANAATYVGCKTTAVSAAGVPTLYCYGPTTLASYSNVVSSATAPASTSAYTMQGLAGSITPTACGNVVLIFDGTIISQGTTTATIGINFQASYGADGTGATSSTTASGNATLNFSTTPAFVLKGMTVQDVTSPSVIPGGTTVSSTTGTTVVMSANATGAGVGSGDTISFTGGPSNGATLGGTQVGPIKKHENGTTLTAATDGAWPFTIVWPVTLTVGTTYWTDIAAEAVTTASDNALSQVGVVAYENCR